MIAPPSVEDQMKIQRAGHGALDFQLSANHR